MKTYCSLEKGNEFCTNEGKSQRNVDLMHNFLKDLSDALPMKYRTAWITSSRIDVSMHNVFNVCVCMYDCIRSTVHYSR